MPPAAPNDSVRVGSSSTSAASGRSVNWPVASASAMVLRSSTEAIAPSIGRERSTVSLPSASCVLMPPSHTAPGKWPATGVGSRAASVAASSAIQFVPLLRCRTTDISPRTGPTLGPAGTTSTWGGANAGDCAVPPPRLQADSGILDSTRSANSSATCHGEPRLPSGGVCVDRPPAATDAAVAGVFGTPPHRYLSRACSHVRFGGGAEWPNGTVNLATPTSTSTLPASGGPCSDSHAPWVNRSGGSDTHTPQQQPSTRISTPTSMCESAW